MKRFLAFAAFAVVAVALSGTANAARFKGVVVAKDAKRKALVTSTARGIRTVRVKGQFSRFRIGQRVVVSARPMADGTFTATKLRPVGKTKRVRFKAVVVRSTSGRLIVSGGRSVFALRMGGLKTRSAGNEGELAPGDKVDIDADVEDGRLEADT